MYYKKDLKYVYLDGKEELELRGQFFLGVESVREVDSSNPAVSVDLHS